MLRADLRALCNLFRTAEGRKALVGHALVLTCLVVASMAIGGRLFVAPGVIAAVQGDETGTLAVLYFAGTLMLPLLVSLGLGVTQLGNELYKAPQLQVLLAAPVTSFSIVFRAYVRTVSAWMLFCLAVGLPPVLGLAQRAQLGWMVALVFPLAALTLIAPVVAAQTLAKIVLARWFSGPRVRLILTSFNVSACLALALLVAIGFFSGEEAGQRTRELLESGIELPWLIAAPASLLARAAGFDVPTGVLGANLALLALPLPFLALSASLYRGSYMSWSVAGKLFSRRASVARRSWPSTPFRSFLAKSRAENVRVRSNLVALAAVVLLMVVMLKAGGAAAPGPVGSPVPEALRQGVHLVFTMSVLSLLVACLCFVAIVGDEQKQIGLLVGAPFPRRELLRSKLVYVALPFVLCFLTVLSLGVPVARVEPAAILVVALAAPPVLMTYVGAIAAVGTWPFAVRVHDEVPLSHNLRTVLPVLLITVFGVLAMFGLHEAKSSVSAAYYGHGLLAPIGGTRAAIAMLGAAWTIGGTVHLVGCRIALANLERLLGPQ